MANFARVWRPQTFEAVVGQDLVVRLLRNSLYSNRIFPVYLFAGQRGCGKTTLARLFAAAVNCARAPEFRLHPHEVQIPCGTCLSCAAMRAGNHTDFIEVDAASHTGVDHVRAILEATTLSPQLGIKKVYLIDEVHMLSKAAFNALLKTLEEPVETVLFLLATTDMHKIPDTVRSRCFQLFLMPLTQQQVVNQLATICTKESIPYDTEALESIAAPSEGSLRDAINNLERAVIAYGRVIQEEVAVLVGAVTPLLLIELWEQIAAKNSAGALKLARDERTLQVSVPQLWRMAYELLRAIIWVRYHAVPQELERYIDRLHKLAEDMTLDRTIAALELLYEFEQSMLKSSHQHAAWELVIVKLCNPSQLPESPKSPELLISSVLQPASPSIHPTSLDELPVAPCGAKVGRQVAGTRDERLMELRNFSEVGCIEGEPVCNAQKLLWISMMSEIQDPLQLSMVRQAALLLQESHEQRLVLQVPHALQIFSEGMVGLRTVLEALAGRLSGKACEVIIRFDEEKPEYLQKLQRPPERTYRPESSTHSAGHSAGKNQKLDQAQAQAAVPASASPSQAPRPASEKIVPDAITQKILTMFPGKITREERH